VLNAEMDNFARLAVKMELLLDDVRCRKNYIYARLHICVSSLEIYFHCSRYSTVAVSGMTVCLNPAKQTSCRLRPDTLSVHLIHLGLQLSRPP
jgi:hypothetical protein